jgi:hypothetical protein
MMMMKHGYKIKKHQDVEQDNKLARFILNVECFRGRNKFDLNNSMMIQTVDHFLYRKCAHSMCCRALNLHTMSLLASVRLECDTSCKIILSVVLSRVPV